MTANVRLFGFCMIHLWEKMFIFIDERKRWDKSVGKCQFSSVEAKESPQFTKCHCEKQGG